MAPTLVQRVARLDIEAKRGATWKMHATYRDDAGDPIDLTGWTARWAMVDEYGQVPAVDIDQTAGTQGQVLLGGAAGTIDVTIKADVTADLTERGYLFDLYLYEPDGEAVPLLEGTFRPRASAIPSA